MIEVQTGCLVWWITAHKVGRTSAQIISVLFPLPVEHFWLSRVIRGVHTYVRNVHTYVRTYVHTYIHTYIHTYVHTYTYVRMCLEQRRRCVTDIHAYISYLYMSVHTDIQTYIHTCGGASQAVCIRVYIHTYLHTYVYVCTYVPRAAAEVRHRHTYIHLILMFVCTYWYTDIHSTYIQAEMRHKPYAYEALNIRTWDVYESLSIRIRGLQYTYTRPFCCFKIHVFQSIWGTVHLIQKKKNARDPTQSGDLLQRLHPTPRPPAEP
jgi:hypothetical protein